jgi:hypothetical protein
MKRNAFHAIRVEQNCRVAHVRVRLSENQCDFDGCRAIAQASDGDALTLCGIPAEFNRLELQPLDKTRRLNSRPSIQRARRGTCPI